MTALMLMSAVDQYTMALISLTQLFSQYFQLELLAINFQSL